MGFQLKKTFAGQIKFMVTAFPNKPLPDNASTGFSLVELMVALMVGALMAYALLNAQHYSLKLSTYDDQVWENLNFAQELIATQGLDKLSRSSPTWIAAPQNPGARWRTVQEPGNREDIFWIKMDTEFNHTILHWSWPQTR